MAAALWCGGACASIRCRRRRRPWRCRRAHERRRERDPAGIPSIDEQVLAVKECLDSGKARAWGLSNETSYGVGAFVAVSVYATAAWPLQPPALGSKRA